MSNVREATFDLMRKLKLTTVFGNPGSTEETFLKGFPSDFSYLLAVQEASALAIADGYAQATRTVALVNLHTAPGLGNALGNLVNSRMTRTPMMLTTGQQTRAMLLMEPWLTNVDAAAFPRPHVKWSYETTHAAETPAALMRAYAAAVQPPQGPVYLSLPLDDWEQEAGEPAAIRSVATKVAPDPDRLREFAAKLDGAQNPALVFGADVDRADAWPEAITRAEKLQAPVYSPPASERCGFPEDHPQFAGGLPFAIGPLSDVLAGHDLVLVVGAPVFRYYPYVPGRYLPDGCSLLHITDNAEEAARAPVGDSLVGDAKLVLSGLTGTVVKSSRGFNESTKSPSGGTAARGRGMSADDLFATMARLRTEDSVIVEESPSNLAALHKHLPTRKPLSFFTMASGGLGWGLPGSVGVALGERVTGRNRPVLSVIGDGSFQHSVQSLWTAVQHRLPLVVLVPVNHEYAILKAFAGQEKTPGVPGLDIPGIDVAGLAAAYGCRSARASTTDEVADLFNEAKQHECPTVIAASIDPAILALL